MKLKFTLGREPDNWEKNFSINFENLNGKFFKIKNYFVNKTTLQISLEIDSDFKTINVCYENNLRFFNEKFDKSYFEENL